MPVEPRSALQAFPSSGDVVLPAASFALKSIRQLVGHTAVWRQPSQLRQDFELVFDHEVIATLRWKKNLGTTAVARSPDGAWTFKAAGYLNPRVSVRLPASDYDFAVFRPRATGEGTLLGLGDRRYDWRCTNSWQQTWAFFDANGDRLLHFVPEGVLPRVTARVEFDDAGALYAETGYLVVLGWYLLVLMADDVAASQPDRR